jgi:FkbM family methyltransferase
MISLKPWISRLRLHPGLRALRERLRGPAARARRQAALDFYRAQLPVGALAFDLGANVGDVSEPLLAIGARVVAVEPQEECAAHLRARLAHHRQFQVVTAAVGAEPGHATLYHYGNPASSSLLSHWFREPLGSRIVPVLTLAELIGRYGVPDFLKVDVEGSEDAVFATLDRPLPLVSFEYVDFGLERVAPCLERLAQGRALEANLSLTAPLRFAFAEWLPAAELAQRLPRWIGDGTVPKWGDIWVRPRREHPAGS